MPTPTDADGYPKTPCLCFPCFPCFPRHTMPCSLTHSISSKQFQSRSEKQIYSTVAPVSLVSSACSEVSVGSCAGARPECMTGEWVICAVGFMSDSCRSVSRISHCTDNSIQYMLTKLSNPQLQHLILARQILCLRLVKRAFIPPRGCRGAGQHVVHLMRCAAGLTRHRPQRRRPRVAALS